MTSRPPKATSPAPPHDAVWRQPRWRAAVRRSLGRWFLANARRLPWRDEPTPYRVWVSEIMCQQTQVATVVPYFERFLRRFPDVRALADADESELLKLWEGLGYYRRARGLHAAARQVMGRHGGQFPTRFEDVLALPGVGRYTAGAILSIADDQRQPIVEGNTRRVYSRWIGLRGDATSGPADRLLWDFAATMLPRRGSGTFNQAAMELGALICTPKSPDCGRCPVRGRCVAHGLGLQEEIPGPVSSIRYESRTEYAFVLRDADSRYLVRRPGDSGRWAGLWDFPRTDAKSLGEAADWLRGEVAASVRVGDELQMIRHAVTKYRIRLHVHAADFDTDPSETGGRVVAITPADGPPAGRWAWIAPSELAELPMNVTARKIARRLEPDPQGGWKLPQH